VEKDSGEKLGMLVRLLLQQVFSNFRELWFAWSHGGGITSGMSYKTAMDALVPFALSKSHLGKYSCEARWAVGIGAP